MGGHHLRRGWEAVVGEGRSPCPLLIPPPLSSPTRTAVTWSVPTSQVSPMGRRQPWVKPCPGVPCTTHLIGHPATSPPSLVAAETAWNVSVSVWGLQLRLHLTSRIPAAFSAALCQRQGGQCEPEAPLYTVTQVSGAGLGGTWWGQTHTDPALVLCSQRALPQGSWRCCCQCRS